MADPAQAGVYPGLVVGNPEESIVYGAPAAPGAGVMVTEVPLISKRATKP